ncbi:MAG: peptide deformylase [Endomicrobiales bacterium]
MSLLPILTIPHPLLKSKAAPLRRVTPAVHALVEDLLETLRHYPRCVGLAAPQAGKRIRLVVVDVSRSAKPRPNHGLLVLINPVITSAAAQKVPGREGCLSIPDFTGNVMRSENVVVEALTPAGRNTRIEAHGFEAVVLQHEIDHLNGILFLDRVTSLKTDVFRRKDYGTPPQR